MRTMRLVNNWLYSFRELTSLNEECWKYVLKRWWKSFIAILTFITTIITILSVCNEIVINFSISFFLINILIVALVSLLTCLPFNYKSFYIKGLHGTKIQLIIGNMFDEKCDMVIPTNTCFDVDWKSIKEQSVQGQFCKLFYDKDSGLLNEDIEKKLKELSCNTTYLEHKVIGKKIQYPINTIITLQSGQRADAQRFHWIAINHSGNESEVIADSMCLHKSINALWEYLSVNRKIRDLCLPILGTGHASINLPLPDVVEYYIDSFIIHSKSNNIVKTLKIYLHPGSDCVFENYKYIANYLKYRSQNTLNLELKYPAEVNI